MPASCWRGFVRGLLTVGAIVVIVVAHVVLIGIESWDAVWYAWHGGNPLERVE